jgi:hypothetical protein
MSDHMLRSLLYQHEYLTLLDALRKTYPQDETDPLEPFPAVHTFLNDLQEDSAPSAEEALDYLLEAAIDHFGHSTRDMFTAVFNFLSTTDRHQQAFTSGKSNFVLVTLKHTYYYLRMSLSTVKPKATKQNHA